MSKIIKSSLHHASLRGTKQSTLSVMLNSKICHPELVSGSYTLGRFRNKFGMTVRRLGHKTLAAIFTFTLVILPVTLLILFNSAKGVEAAWANEDWGYRKSIAITAHTSSENNVYISTTLSNTNTLVTNGQLQSDCGDLRFTKQNGEVLPYYIVSGCNGASTVVHINFDTFPAGAQTIYFYYGNPSIYDGFRAIDFSTEATSYTIGSTGSEEKAPSPVAYWKFDDATGTTAQDSTTNNNDGTLTNSPTWQTEDMCVSGKCLKFDGTDDYVSVSDTNVLDYSTGSMTLASWVRRIPGGTNTPIFSKRVNGSSDTNYSLFFNNNGTLGTWNGSNFLTTTGTVSLNTWHYIVAVYSTTSITYYVDGNLFETINQTSTTANAGPLYIGTAYPNAEPFSGFIDEPKIYNYARSADQIKADYANRGGLDGSSSVIASDQRSNPAALSNGLVGYWKMDETATPSLDSSGNGNSGTWVGNAVAAAGKFGNGISLDGTGDWVSVGAVSQANFGAGNFTLCNWFKTSGTEEDIISNGISSNGNYLLMTYLGKLRGHIWYSGNSNTLDGTTTVNDGTWHHGCEVVDDTKIYIYVDGKLDGSAALSGTKTGLTGSLVIGSRNATSGSYNFNGQLDESRVYNRALSPAEVSQLYNFAPGPVAYYDFNENTGTTVNDKSGNANTGTWNGSGTDQWKPGKNGNAGNFDGSSDYVQINNFPTIVNDTSFAISSWVYLNNTTGLKRVVEKEDAGGGYGIYLNGSTPTFFVLADGVWTGATGSSLNTNTWYHLTGVYDSILKKKQIYVNGIKGTDVSVTATDSTPTSANLIIGAESDGTVGPNWFNGQIDDVKVYNYARTQQQIIEDMTNGSDVGGSGYTTASSSTGGSIAKPVGYWKFDEGYGTTANNVGNGGTALNGTLTNMASPATSTSGWTQSGKVGKALNFDGTDDYVDLPSISSIDTVSTTTNYTFSSWIKTSSNNVYVIRNGNTASSPTHVPISVRVLASTGKVRFDVYDGSNNPFVDSISAVNDNQWHFITAVRNTTADKLELYIDGILVGQATDTTTGTMTAAVSADIGRDPAGSGYFNGSIDEIKVYSFALTAEQVKLDMNQGAAQVVGTLSDNSTYQKAAANQEYCVPGDTTSCAAPVGRWDFDEATGTTVNDSSGNANTGTWNGTGTTHWKSGKVNKSGNFNGSDDYVSTANASSTAMPYTIEAWVKLNSLPSTYRAGIVTYRVADNNYDKVLYISTSGTPGLYVYDSSGHWVDGTTTIATGQWYHLAASVSSGGVKVYVNGKLENSTADTSTIVNAANWRIGWGSTAPAAQYRLDYVNGQIDQVRIFNYARSAAQVAWDYNKGAPVGHWRLDECQGTVANDASGNANTGTITIGASGTQTGAGTCTDGLSTSAWYNGKTGKRNYSLNFDGTDDYISVPSSSTNNFDRTNPFSLSLWVKLSSLSGNPVLISKNTGTPQVGYYLILASASNRVALVLINTTSNYIQRYSGQTLSANNWYHILTTYDGSTNVSGVKIYINGISQTYTNNDVNTLTTQSIATAANFVIGAYNGGTSSFSNGQIDDARVYNYALTATQVKNLFNDGAVNYGPVTGAP